MRDNSNVDYEQSLIRRFSSSTAIRKHKQARLKNDRAKSRVQSSHGRFKKIGDLVSKETVCCVGESETLK